MADQNIILLITADNKASQVLQQVQEQAAGVQAKVAEANEKISQSASKVNASALNTAQAFAGLGAGAVSLATSFTTLERAQVSVEVAQKRLLTAQASAMSAQDAYNKAVAKFGPDSREAHEALLKLQAAQEQLGIAQDKARLTQDHLTDTYANFAAGIGPQVISLVFGMQGAFKLLGITSVSQLIPAIAGVGTALKTAFISNPIGLVIIGITTVVALLAFNVGGLRDKVVDLGNQILNFIDAHLKPLGDAIRFLIDLFKPLVNIFQVAMPNAMGITQDKVKELEGVTIPSFQNMEQESINLGNAIGTTSDHIIRKHKEVAGGVEATILRNLDNYGKFGRTASQVYDDVSEHATRARNHVKKMHEEIDISLDKLATNTELQSGRIILAGQAISKVLEQIKALQGISSQGQRDVESLIAQRAGHPRGGGIFLTRADEEAISLERQRVANQDRLINEEINRLTRQTQSFALAGGISPQQLFGGSFTVGPSGTVFSSGMLQAITPGGTLISALSGNLAGSSVVNARAALARGFVTRADIRHAQHGLDEMFTSPSMIMVGEAGPEHVKVTPANKGTHSNTVILKLVTDLAGRLIRIEDEVSGERIPLIKASKARSVV